ncbi:allantoate amidohydrolase [Nocardioides sp. 503]|uniref:allantoate amidohydrolase n=1 Tax=Nocardioides sp. 503 TaxID=2508326 RepID=UPI001FD65811|nr:allantoate amidohydrolase [Nocardioides sp. 503]
MPLDPTTSDFRTLWDELAPVGRDRRTGGYARFAWTREDATLREWFVGAARARGLDVEVDRNGNLWAWWGAPGDDAVVTGSHLDSVPGGGAYDGPLGVVSALLAVDRLRAQGVVPERPFAVVAFADEEGARFGVACMGSRLLSGAIGRDRALALRDDAGVTLAEALSAAGVDPAHAGRDEEALRRIGVFVELHVEQGRGLVDLDAPVGVASSIWPHGRWHHRFEGEGNHAGTTLIADRHDPMLPFADLVLGGREAAAELGAVLTVGRVLVGPNGTNAIPVTVDAWIDARAPEEATVRALVERVERLSRDAAGRRGVSVEVSEESWSGLVSFDAALRDRLAGAVAGLAPIGAVPVLGTGAGHDAGVLAAYVPTAMVFVRNPTGVSHSPAEHAEEADCVTGVHALASALEDLLTGE